MPTSSIANPSCYTQPTCVSLLEARCGDRLRIVGVTGKDAGVNRLREMGFCESVEICKVTDRGACICVLSGARVAIAADYARNIRVAPLSPVGR